MPWNEIDEGELLLYVSGALPFRRRALIFLRSRFDAALCRALARLGEEKAGYHRDVEDGLARRLAAWLPAVPPWKPIPGTPALGMAARAAGAWRTFPFRPKAVFAGIALSSLLAVSVLYIQSAGLARDGAFRTSGAQDHGLPGPLLILGY